MAGRRSRCCPASFAEQTPLTLLCQPARAGVARLSDLLCMIKHQYHVYSYKERSSGSGESSVCLITHTADGMVGVERSGQPYVHKVGGGVLVDPVDVAEVATPSSRRSCPALRACGRRQRPHRRGDAHGRCGHGPSRSQCPAGRSLCHSLAPGMGLWARWEPIRGAGHATGLFSGSPLGTVHARPG